MESRGTVSLITLGCGRNQVDSEELAASIARGGWELADRVTDPSTADVIVVNTCGFIESAKQASIETLVAAANSEAKVVAVGCAAERYGRRLAEALPEVDAVLSFDDYPEIARRLDDVHQGRTLESHEPVDRRRLLPISPVDRRGETSVVQPGHGRARPEPSATVATAGQGFLRLPVPGGPIGDGPVALLKLASGCDRRCSFCAIPTFRGAFVSRLPDELVAEAQWLAENGARELILVSENSTAYGKDLGDVRALEKLLPRLAAVVERVRVSYLQPAEMRPSLIEAMTHTSGVAPYFDLSFQHASGSVLRSMRRFGDREHFLDLLARIRAENPDAGFRSNFIVGFPGETDSDFREVELFLEQARMDAIGVFGYSDEEGTEAARLPGKLERPLIDDRVARLSELASSAMTRRANERIGTEVEVIAKTHESGWAAHQGPSDGQVIISGAPVAPGVKLNARVTGVQGFDLVVQPDQR